MATQTWTGVSRRAMLSGALAASLTLAAAGAALADDQASPPPPADNTLSGVTVPGAKKPHHYDPAKLNHIMPEVSGTQITVTKKTTVTKLDQQPTIVDNNQRQLFNKSPGLLITEQNTPDQFNFSYRGLGNPQESEYVLVLQDGIPISSDWIGFPTLYYVPQAQSISEIQLIRGGSSLLYGPEPAPAVNFVSRRPTPGEPMTGYTEQVGGSHGLYSTYNVLEGTNGPFEYRAEAGYLRADGERDNARYHQGQLNLYLAYRPNDRSLTWLDLKAYQVSAGNPGKLSITQYNADPDFASTPLNHDWVDRYAAVLGHSEDFGDGWRLEAKGWMSYMDLSSRAAAAGPTPATTTLQQEIFQNEGADVRLRKRWGEGNAFTVGAVAYHSNGPFRRWADTDLTADQFDHSGTPTLDENRSTNYGAVFAENVFRFGSFHIVPSARLDWEQVKADELIKPPTANYHIDVDTKKTIPLFALGFGNDFGHGNETYLNVSQGWRPVRYFDVASPFGQMAPDGDPDPSKSVSWEAGVHGTPLPGLFYDIGVFWIDFSNRIESQVSPSDPLATISVNSGDTRHRGVEGELSYDFLAKRGGDAHLTAFGNFAYLDAEFTATHNPLVQIGNIPAFAPKWMLKGGLTWRKDKAYDVSFTGQYVSSQFFQDSNQPAAGGAVPAKVPSFAVFDLAGDYYLTRNVRLTGGVSNIFDRQYYDRVFQNGIEPAPGRTIYAGIALGF